MTSRTSKPSLMSALSLALPPTVINTGRTLKVGFLGPLSGKLKSWAEPGYHGCLIWKDWVNEKGGIRVGNRRYKIDIVVYDTEFKSDKALAGARELLIGHGVEMLLMLGGNDFSRPLRDFINQRKALVTTLLPSDLTPDARTLIAPSEVHPIYNVTGVEWLVRDDPSLKTVAMCTQNDEHGLPSIATYRAAFEAAGLKLVDEHLFPIETSDFSQIIGRLLEKDPDVLCWDTAYEPFVHAMTVEAYKRGFKGRLLSCTCDNYRSLIEKTSPQFMENFVFQFPDFDDPRLDDPRINFDNPKRFFDEFCRRYPGEWSAVSWEYAAILEMWKTAVERARTVDPLSVLAMMKMGGKGHHVFGWATWWGRELFGVDNALVGEWPVVTIRDGRARIVDFLDPRDWWAANSHILIKHMRVLDLMWDQREEVIASSAGHPDFLR
ncbi:MAG: ABC transporter substrate-binding protein [Hyphomicrobium sp.]|nr:ABC transporter substrate-binding protein [Hyphomicrobium sp.]